MKKILLAAALVAIASCAPSRVPWSIYQPGIPFVQKYDLHGQPYMVDSVYAAKHAHDIKLERPTYSDTAKRWPDSNMFWR